jgi:hypothetical protein
MQRSWRFGGSYGNRVDVSERTLPSGSEYDFDMSFGFRMTVRTYYDLYIAPEFCEQSIGFGI